MQALGCIVTCSVTVTLVILHNLLSLVWPHCICVIYDDEHGKRGFPREEMGDTLTKGFSRP